MLNVKSVVWHGKLKELDRKDTQKRPGKIVFRMDDMESLGLSKNDVQVRNEWRRITGFNWFTHGVCECVWIHYLHKYCVCFCQPTRLNLQMNCFIIATVAVIVLTDLAYILLWDDCVTYVYRRNSKKRDFRRDWLVHRYTCYSELLWAVNFQVLTKLAKVSCHEYLLTLCNFAFISFQ